MEGFMVGLSIGFLFAYILKSPDEATACSNRQPMPQRARDKCRVPPAPFAATAPKRLD